MIPQRVTSIHLSSQLCSAFQQLLAHNFVCFQGKKSDKATVHYLLNTKEQTDTVRNQLVNM